MQENKLNERIGIFDAAVRHKKPLRVPTFASILTWKIFDSDITPKPTIAQATGDWSLMEKIVRECIERYNFDAYMDYGLRNNGNFAKVFNDSTIYRMNDTAVQVTDSCYMEEDEYDEYIANVDLLNYTKIVPRRYGKLTLGQIKQLVKYTKEYIDYGARISEIAEKEYALPLFSAGDWIFQGADYLLTGYRGLKTFSTDMRRCPEKVEEACMQNDAASYEQVVEAFKRPSPPCAFDIAYGPMGHSIMNHKQFERFMWNMMKKTIDLTIAEDRKILILFQADILRFIDLMQEIPGGNLAIGMEKDDIFEVRKKLPNMCLMGGMTVDMLSHGTPKECVDLTKRLCDGLCESGYIFAINKALSYPNDAKRENLLAVQDYLLNTRL